MTALYCDCDPPYCEACRQFLRDSIEPLDED